MKNKLIILLIVFLLMSLGYEEVNADIISNYYDINVVAEDIDGINGGIEGKVVADTINCENFKIGNKVEEGTAIYLTDDENSKNVNTNFDSLKEQEKVETNVDNFPKEIKEVKENLKEYQQQLSDKQLDWKNQKISIDDNGDNTIEVNNKGKYNNESEIHSDNNVEYTKITIEKNEDGKIEKSVISVNDKNEMSIVSNSSDNILVQDNKIEINDSLELKYKDKSGDFISNCDNTSKAIIIGSVALIMCSLLGIYIIKHRRK